MKKSIVGTIVTVALIIGVGTAAYQSAEDQKALKTTLEIQAAQIAADLPTSTRTTTLSTNTRAASTQIAPQTIQEEPKPIVIEPLKGFFEDKLSSQTKLHTVGVYEGLDPNDDGEPWWSKCEGTNLSGGSTFSEEESKENTLSCFNDMNKNSPPGEVDIDIRYTKAPILLALMAYNETIWNVSIESDVNLEGIILAGYDNQTLQGIPENIPVLALVHKEATCGDCIRGTDYFFTYSQEGNEYKEVASKLHGISGLHPSSFQGSYKAGYFSVSNQLD